MRHLIVCCDGTWQKADQPTLTNVCRLKNAVAKTARDGTEQVAEHFPGVGAGNSLVDKVLGGVAGIGLSGNVMTAYRWLVRKYDSGDRISLFGFSRGAYTARSLAGMIGACGLLDPTGLGDKDLETLVEQIYRSRYRAGDGATRAGAMGSASAMTLVTPPVSRFSSSGSGTPSGHSGSLTT